MLTKADEKELDRKKIDGKYYYALGAHASKKHNEELADWLREHGYPARVVMGTGWARGLYQVFSTKEGIAKSQ